MRLTGKIIKDTRIIKKTTVEKDYVSGQFREALEECLIKICRELDIQVPLWLNKNTTEFVNYRRTFFSQEQFLERVNFDRFEINLEKD